MPFLLNQLILIQDCYSVFIILNFSVSLPCIRPKLFMKLSWRKVFVDRLVVSEMKWRQCFLLTKREIDNFFSEVIFKFSFTSNIITVLQLNFKNMIFIDENSIRIVKKLYLTKQIWITNLFLISNRCDFGEEKYNLKKNFKINRYFKKIFYILLVSSSSFRHRSGIAWFLRFRWVWHFSHGQRR